MAPEYPYDRRFQRGLALNALAVSQWTQIEGCHRHQKSRSMMLERGTDLTD